jgi:hypothetical protein
VAPVFLRELAARFSEHERRDIDTPARVMHITSFRGHTADALVKRVLGGAVPGTSYATNWCWRPSTTSRSPRWCISIREDAKENGAVSPPKRGRAVIGWLAAAHADSLGLTRRDEGASLSAA